jgi:hypothetical protein
VSVIAFSGFIVVAQHADPIDDERQSILERVDRASRRSRQAPNDNLGERPSIKHVPFVDQQFGFLVGDDTNSRPALSISPTAGGPRFDLSVFYVKAAWLRHA